MGETLYSKKSGNLSPIKNVKRSIARKLLRENSQEFLVDHEQLVVFSCDIISHPINLDGFYENEELTFTFS